MKAKGKISAFVGISGLLIVLLLNLYAWVGLQQSAAIPFQSSWYSAWLPIYVVWSMFLIIGLSQYLKQRKGK